MVLPGAGKSSVPHTSNQANSIISSPPPLPLNPYQNLYEGQGESALGPVSTHHPPLGQYNYPNMWLFKHSFDQINRWDCSDNGFGTSALLVFTVYLWIFKHFKIFLIVLCFVLYTLRITDIDHHSRVCRSYLLNKSYFYCNYRKLHGIEYITPQKPNLNTVVAYYTYKYL